VPPAFDAAETAVSTVTIQALHSTRDLHAGSAYSAESGCEGWIGKLGFPRFNVLTFQPFHVATPRGEANILRKIPLDSGLVPE
jgi:hypothetical protein